MNEATQALVDFGTLGIAVLVLGFFSWYMYRRSERQAQAEHEALNECRTMLAECREGHIRDQGRIALLESVIRGLGQEPPP